ncbi:MAG: hypothetical protein ACOCTT_01465 [archaeon]
MTERLIHKDKKTSTLKWFIIWFIPILDLWFMWRAANLISGHEEKVDKFKSISHRRSKGSSLLWFALLALPIYSVMISSLIIPIYLVLPVLIILISAIVILFVIWKMAEVISGHSTIYKTHEKLEHKEKKQSTLKWFLIAIIPFLNLYFYWKMAEKIAGHEVAYR